MLLIRELRKNLRRIEREMERQLRDQTDCCGVTVAQCHVLLEIDAEGPLSLNGLAGRLKLDASTLSRTVEGLVKASLVQREVNPNNRRAVILSLTTTGRTKVDTIHRDCDAYYTQLLKEIPSTSQASLLKGVRLLADMMERAGSPLTGNCGCHKEEQEGDLNTGKSECP